MACLVTNGRQGLLAAVGKRRYRSQKFLCQLLLQQQKQENRSDRNANTEYTSASSSLSETPTPTPTLTITTKKTATKAAASPSTQTSTSPMATTSLTPSISISTSTSIPISATVAATLPTPLSLSLSPSSTSSLLLLSLLNDQLSKRDSCLLRNSIECWRTKRTYSTLTNCKNIYKIANTKAKCCWTTPTYCRSYSSAHTTHQPAGPVRDVQIDPYILLEDELKFVYDDIRQKLFEGTTQPELYEIASYYFDGQGKALRPMVTLLMAKAINYHLNKESSVLLQKQRHLAFFAEMAHSASLVHDDVIDQSDFRRNKPSVNMLWNHKKVTMAGDFILALASIIIARLNKKEVTILCSQIITDLVQGEFMQLGSRETENERFTHYLTKTYRKTASLIANTLKATAVLAEADEKLIETAFQYGRNIGLAFQLVDDMLDFVSSTEAMGKPTAADLKLGLATAPVLFACEKFPELNAMIMRRFNEPGDAERAFELVHKSNGLEQTRFLARKHCNEAIRIAQEITESPYQKGLQVVADLVLHRMK